MTEIRWLVLKSAGDLVKRDEIWDEKFVAGREGGGGRGFTKSSSETDGEEIEVWRGGTEVEVEKN